MSALLVVRHEAAAEPGRLQAAAGASLAAQGFAAPIVRAIPGGSLCWYPTPGNPDSASLFQEPGEAGELVACVGTLFYRGRSGGEALRALWRDFTVPEAFGWAELWGNYLLAVAKQGRTWLFGDPVGSVKLYHTTDRAVWSTSLLACVAASGRDEVDRIGAIDYVMSGSNHGERTPLASVRIADPTGSIDLATGEVRPLTSPQQWSAGERPRTMADAIDLAAAILSDRAKAIGTAFEGRIRAALSGGFDSRLIVAALRSAGAVPALHVYGSAGDEDVRIAREAAHAIGLPLAHIDKAELNRSLPPLDAAGLRAQALFFDGLPTDGIFDRGADRITRIRQSADGHIALNGGGGEILRNFFYLHDRPFSAAEVFQAFYANWLPAAVPSRVDRDAYRDYMVDAIERSVGARGRLTRSQVELVYPLFRVRYWTARNGSLAARCGHFLAPLADPEMVRLSQALPLRWKDYGRFEAALLARLDPVLGSIPLSYGFTPADGPAWPYRVRMWLQHRRPPALRANSTRLRALLRRLAPLEAEHDASPGTASLHGRTDVIRAAGLTDSGQLDRARTLGTLLAGIESA